MKRMSTERGLPMVKGIAGLAVQRLTAEHGIINLQDPAAPVQVGDKIEMWVHYSDVTVSLHNRMYGVRNGYVEEVFQVER
jgi:D-serine deaminase-like pyridoxal phosphate-dependent protein